MDTNSCTEPALNIRDSAGDTSRPREILKTESVKSWAFDRKENPSMGSEESARVLSILVGAALIASLHTSVLQEHPSLTLSRNLYRCFLKAGKISLLERDVFLYVFASLTPFLHFYCILVLSFTNIFLLHSYSFLTSS